MTRIALRDQIAGAGVQAVDAFRSQLEALDPSRPAILRREADMVDRGVLRGPCQLDVTGKETAGVAEGIDGPYADGKRLIDVNQRRDDQMECVRIAANDGNDRRIGQLVVDSGTECIDQHLEHKRGLGKGLGTHAWAASVAVAVHNRDGVAFAKRAIDDIDYQRGAPRADVAGRIVRSPNARRAGRRDGDVARLSRPIELRALPIGDIPPGDDDRSAIVDAVLADGDRQLPDSLRARGYKAALPVVHRRHGDGAFTIHPRG